MWQFVVTVLVLLAATAESKRILRISPDISCKSLNEEVAQNVTCSLKTVQSKRLLSLDAYIVPTAQRIFVQAHLQYAREPTMKVITMNITEDLCEFLHGRKRQLLLSILFFNIRHLFYNLQCPTQGFVGIRNADFQLQDLGAVPSGFYRFNIVYLINKSIHAFSLGGVAQYVPPSSSSS